MSSCFSYPLLLRQDAESSLNFRVQSGDGKPGFRHQLDSFYSLDSMGCHLHTLSLSIYARHCLGTIANAGDSQLAKQKGWFGFTVWDSLICDGWPYCFRVAAKQSILGKLLIQQYHSYHDQEAKEDWLGHHNPLQGHPLPHHDLKISLEAPLFKGSAIPQQHHAGYNIFITYGLRVLPRSKL